MKCFAPGKGPNIERVPEPWKLVEGQHDIMDGTVAALRAGFPLVESGGGLVRAALRAGERKGEGEVTSIVEWRRKQLHAHPHRSVTSSPPLLICAAMEGFIAQFGTAVYTEGADRLQAQMAAMEAVREWQMMGGWRHLVRGGHSSLKCCFRLWWLLGVAATGRGE